MKIEYTKDGGLNINGLDIPISPEKAALVYHDLFMLFMAAYGREMRICEQTQDVLEEAEDILKGENNG